MASQQKLRQTSAVVLMVALFIGIGYIIIFVSVLRQPSNDAQNRMQLERALYEKDRLKEELRVLKGQLAKVAKVRKTDSVAVGALITTVQAGGTVGAVALSPEAYRPGVIVLGMHRSGTSIVGGLMNKMGLNTGGPLIRPWHDNEKGFFERVDVVLQNDYLFKNQVIHYSSGTFKYDSLKGLKDVLNSYEPTNGKFFNEGRRGLAFLNDPASYPWMLKDPRLCITLRTWLPLFNFVPAVLFTYRHPMDVAMSMHKRETEQFRVQRGLKLWYVYNKRALQQSHDLCRVTTSHKKMMAAPQTELDRIYDELRGCGVPVPNRAQLIDINDFIDPKLQHGRSAMQDQSCTKDFRTLSPEPSVWIPEDDHALKLYQACMHFFCALEDGSAYKFGFTYDESIQDV